MKSLDLSVASIPVSELIPYAKNARMHSDVQIKQIAKSIEHFGFVNPVLARGDMTIIAGHGRVLAAGLVGLATIPVIVLDHLSNEQARALTLADNKIAENSKWDMEILAAEIAELQNLDLDIDLADIAISKIDFAVDLIDPSQPVEMVHLNTANPDSKTIDYVKKTGGFVSLEFTLTKEDRNLAIAALRSEQARRGLDNTAQALISLLKEITQNGK